MKKLFIVLFLIIPFSATAQNWTPEETEVIEFINNCQSMSWSADYDTWFDACWHEDIIYVNPNNGPIRTINKEYSKGRRSAYGSKIKDHHRLMTTLSVKVHGDTAVIYYFVEGLNEMDDSEPIAWKGLSSETVIKRDGKWKVINKNDWPYPPQPDN